MAQFAEQAYRRELNAARRTGTIAAAIYNSSPRRKKNAKWLTSEDFIAQKPRKLSQEQMVAAFDAWASGIGMKKANGQPEQ